LRAGAELTVHNRSQGAVEALCAEGAGRAESPKEAAERAGEGIVFLMLTNTEATEAVLSGERGLFAGLRPGALVVDMGSNRVDATRRWAAEAERAGASWLDAPVSGGEVGAEAGTLAIFVGGEPEACERARAFFEILGKQATLLGPSGSGQLGKLTNQILVAQGVAAVSEALYFAGKFGLDLAAMREALLAGFAQSRILDLHGKRMIEGAFEPGGTATNQLKDVDECLRVAADSGLRLPMLERNQELWRKMIDAGLGPLDHSGIYKWYEESDDTKG